MVVQFLKNFLFATCTGEWRLGLRAQQGVGGLPRLSMLCKGCVAVRLQRLHQPKRGHFVNALPFPQPCRYSVSFDSEQPSIGREITLIFAIDRNSCVTNAARQSVADVAVLSAFKQFSIS